MSRGRIPPPPTPAEAVALQRRLAARVVRARTFGPLRTVAGVDVGIHGDVAVAAVVRLAYPSLEVLETAMARRPVDFPYVPGLLGFREVPVAAEACARLAAPPDLLLVDGHGLAHPRRFGVACHLGVVLDLPAIGCGKSRLVGEHREPGTRRGSCTRLVDRGEVIGAVLRTREGVRPVVVSIGHRIDLETAVRVVLRCARRFRLPEPIRAADRAAAEAP
ncbi:MAG: deoxyribonuclease V [Planctomycetota bacterium]